MAATDEINAIAERAAAPGRSSASEVFRIFLRLGLTCFGGPVAHIGYFRQEFVQRQKWLDEAAFADLVALSQFLPGPSSSQVGFAVGVSRRGLVGGLLAWCGFTLPSAALLFAFSQIAASLTGKLAMAAQHGLRVVAVAVVAQAVFGMARILTPDAKRLAIAAIGAAIVVFVADAFGQIAAILMGASAGLLVCRNMTTAPQGHLGFAIPKTVAWFSLVTFAGLLFGLPLLAGVLHSHLLEIAAAFYRSGALVFGGGHVVLPLLSDAVVKPGWISQNLFLAGYGAAQAVPGPLFSVASYLGAALARPPNGLLGSALALVAIFLPGMLILTGALPYWDQFRSRPDAQAVMCGVNATVVGILAAALYDPLWKTTITGLSDFAVAAVAFLMLTVAKRPPWQVVLTSVLLAAGLSFA